jgi:transketolase
MTSAKHGLGNLVAIIDRNRLKAMDETDCSKLLNPLSERWASFGWAVTEIDGHDMSAICEALDWSDAQSQQPSAIIANTIKGKGVSFIEGQPGYHNAPLNEDQFLQATRELKAELALVEEE